MLRPVLLSALVLAGCVPLAPTGVPKSARLTQSELIVETHDGETCRADWRAAPSGRLSGCTGLNYVVTEEAAGLNPLRNGAEGIEQAAGKSLFQPMAKIRLSNGRTSWTFQSPQPSPLGWSDRRDR